MLLLTPHLTFNIRQLTFKNYLFANMLLIITESLKMYNILYMLYQYTVLYEVFSTLLL